MNLSIRSIMRETPSVRSILNSCKIQNCKRCGDIVPNDRIQWYGNPYCSWWCEYWETGKGRLTDRECKEHMERNPRAYFVERD